MINKKSLAIFTLAILQLFFTQESFSQIYDESNGKLQELELEDALKIPIKPEVSVASQNNLMLKKSPGVITLITENEIINSGARDLMEVLQLIPGIFFNHDIEGGISIGIRGIWAEEGKTLVLIDGQEMNDVLWPTVLFGNHFPISQIKRVEVLRGPGSVVYGGQAELAVINVISKSANDLNGFSSNVDFGFMLSDPVKDFTRRNISLSYGQEFGDFKIVAHGLWGRGNLSDKIFTDFYNNSYDMTLNSDMNPTFLNLGLSYKDLSVRFIMDLYKIKSRGLAGLNMPDSIPSLAISHDGYYAEVKYNYSPFENITITPKFNYKRQYPWRSDDEIARKLDEMKDYEGFFFSKSIERYTGNVTVKSNITENIAIIGGGEFYYDIANALDPKSADFGKDKNQNIINYHNLSLFGQGLYKTDFGCMTIGARYENHSAYGSFFVPRIALTGVLGDFHTKILYSKAFRAPGIQNIIYFNPQFSKNSNIKPENTTAIEIETGYQIGENMELSLNLFDISILDPIIYFADENNQDSYDNFEKTGTRGIELDYKIEDDKLGYANLAYSFSTVSNNTVDVYKIPNRNDLLLGFPAHKIIFNGSLNITEKLSLNPTAIFYSQRYGFNSQDENENPIIKEFSPVLMLNLKMLYKDFIFNGLNLGVSVYNILDQNYYYIQPYNGYHAALPGASREFLISLGYKFSL